MSNEQQLSVIDKACVYIYINTWISCTLPFNPSKEEHVNEGVKQILPRRPHTNC